MFLALTASVLIIFGSPYVGELQSTLRSSFPVSYRWIIGSTVAIATTVALGCAFLSLRRRQRDAGLAPAGAGPTPRVRHALMVVAIATGAIYARATSTENLDVNLVEAFHFVEYGIVTWLFYRVWNRRSDASAMVFPLCAALAVGIADESVQWFVPGRVGEFHDVLLNAIAIVCGLLVSVAIDPPASLRLPRSPGARFTISVAVSGLLVAAAAFVDRVHLGHEINDGNGPIFRSHDDAVALAAAATERVSRWRTSPPPVRGFAREDHYLGEGLWHVQRRDLAVTASDWWPAWNENTILERFYAPVLDRGWRWTEPQRTQADRRAHEASHPSYHSDAAPYPIYLTRRPMFWTMTLLFAAALVAVFRI